MHRNTFRIILMLMTGLNFTLPLNAQNKDKAIFITSRPGFYQNSIMKYDRDVDERLSF